MNTNGLKNLGRLVSIQSEEFNYGPYPVFSYAEGSSGAIAKDEARQAALNLAPQDIEVTANVRVSYKLSSF